MTKEEKKRLEQDYDALNKKGGLDKLRITKEHYVNTTNEIRNMIIKYLLAQDVINYYNELKGNYITEIDKTEETPFERNNKKGNIFKRILKRTK